MDSISKKIILLVSNSIQNPDLLSGNDLLIRSLKEIGYNLEIVIFPQFYELITKLKSEEPDLVFNLFENTSDDIAAQMHIVGVLEILRIPYIGHNPFVLGLSNMKNFVKRLLENKRIPSIPYQVYRTAPKSTYLDFPVILRPANMDWPLARIKARKILDLNSLKSAVANYLDHYKQPILVESLIPGRIFMVGVFGNTDSKILPVCEAVLNENGYTYDCPAKIDTETEFHLRDIALHVYKYLMGKDYALVSFLIDKDNEIYVADYHPNPSLLADSVFQLGFQVSEYEFTDFLKLIINESLKKDSNDENQRIKSKRSRKYL
jgi:D-alanine-D-alanine ligase